MDVASMLKAYHLALGLQVNCSKGKNAQEVKSQAWKAIFNKTETQWKKKRDSASYKKVLQEVTM